MKIKRSTFSYRPNYLLPSKLQIECTLCCCRKNCGFYHLFLLPSVIAKRMHFTTRKKYQLTRLLSKMNQQIFHSISSNLKHEQKLFRYLLTHVVESWYPFCCFKLQKLYTFWPRAKLQFLQFKLLPWVYEFHQILLLYANI